MLLNLQVAVAADLTPDSAAVRTAANDAAMRVARVWTEPQYSHEDTTDGVRQLHFICDAVPK